MIQKILTALAHLPLGVLYGISDIAYVIMYHIIGYRRKVVWENLTSSFPEKSKKEIKQIERKFYRFLGDQIVESLKTLHISDKEMRERVEVKNYDLVNSALEKGTDVVLLMGHYCNWEWAQEITKYFLPDSFMVSIYHPLNDKTWDEIMIKMRSRWGAHIVPMKNAPRTLLNKANSPWVCGFIADAFTWYKHDDNWIDFLHHKTWFIYGPEEIGRKVNASFLYLEMNRKKRGHYEIIFHTIEPEETDKPFPYTRQFWKDFEKTILKAPAYWLWSHKRWK